MNRPAVARQTDQQAVATHAVRTATWRDLRQEMNRPAVARQTDQPAVATHAIKGVAPRDPYLVHFCSTQRGLEREDKGRSAVIIDLAPET
jgi:hypothetical protein